MTREYECIITSNNSYHTHIVTTTSAAKCAAKYGRCEGGEIVTVKTKRSRRPLSCVMYTPEDGGKYYAAIPY